MSEPSTLPRDESNDSQAPRAIAALAISASALLVGTVHTPVLCGIAILLGVGVLLSWFGASLKAVSPSATVLLFTGVFLTVYTAFQALPLPSSLVRAVDPTTAEIWNGALAPLAKPGPAWHPLSLDPSATRVEVLRGTVYVAAFLLALRISTTRGGTRFLARVIMATAGLVALASVLHPLLGIRKLYGVYEPAEHIDPRHIAPLLNANQLAAYLNIGFCLTLGEAVADRHQGRNARFFAATLALALAATNIWVASRGGVLSMSFGALVVLVLVQLWRRLRFAWLASAALPLLVIGAAIGMIVLGSVPEATKELTDTDANKLKIALEGFRLVTHHWLLGVGRGAYDVAFPAVRTLTGYYDVTNPENIVVQWIAEWGVPVALAGALAMSLALRPAVLLRQASPAIGAWSALAAVAIHNLVDFSSEIPAVGIACATCAAMVVARRGRAHVSRATRWVMFPRTVAIVTAGAVLAASGVAFAGWPHEVARDRRRLHRELELAPGSRYTLVGEALSRHPSEAYIPYIGSVAAFQTGESVLPWIERTLELSPTFPPAHYVLALQLGSRSPAQARLEYRLAITEGGLLLLESAIQQAAPLVRRYQDAVEVLPSTELRSRAAEDLIARVGDRLPATKLRLGELEASADPLARLPLLRSVQDSLSDLGAPEVAPWCDHRELCEREGLAAADRLVALVPGNCDAASLRARVLVASEQSPRALRELEATSQTSSDPDICLQWLGELALKANDLEHFTSAEEQLERAGCSEPTECASNLKVLASFEARRGNLSRSLKFLSRAVEITPERQDVLAELASVAVQLDLHGEALERYKQLEKLSADPVWKELADREQLAALKVLSDRARTH